MIMLKHNANQNIFVIFENKMFSLQNCKRC